jgi:hypothetical protein
MTISSDIDICARALLRLGEKPISSFSDGTDPSTTCANIYPELKQMILTIHPWRRTMVKKALQTVSGTPANKWTKKYQLPSARMGEIQAVYNTTATGPGVKPIVGFELFGDELFTDEDVIVVDYQSEIAEADFPHYISELMILALTAEIAFPITDQANLAELYDRKAWGLPNERRQGGYFGVCKTLDSQGSEQNVIVAQDDLVAARFS